MVLDKNDLLAKVINAIEISGWIIEWDGIFKHPLQITARKEGEEENLLIYIWNITHGGKTRSEDEFRIQITGVKELSFLEGYKTLLLGRAEIDNTEVYAAFNPYIHSKFGFSPSIQVSKKALQKALKQGIDFQEKSKNQVGITEIVITLSSAFLMEYVSRFFDEYHSSQSKVIEIQEAEIIIKNPLNVNLSLDKLQNLPTERRRVLQKLNKIVRERQFQIGITKVYGARCAMCGLQAKLTDAAHIIAVGKDGSDEITNGLCLCKNHHKAFDLGIVGVAPDYTILLNERYVKKLKEIGLDGKFEQFLKDSRIGEKIFLPSEKIFYPNPEYLKKNLQSKGM